MIPDARADVSALAGSVVELLRQQSATVAVAESLTGGLVGAAVTDIAGASGVFRGAVTAYGTDLKSTLLDVDAVLLARVGPVHPDVAVAMAAGVRQRMAATYGLATTGVAGPDPQAGRSPGTVYVAVVGPGGRRHVEGHHFGGDRAAVRQQTLRAALALLADAAGGK